MRYFLYFSYDGTRYAGMQIQPNAPSIQEELEKALSTILNEPISITAAGRTDAGVHARQMVAHFDTEQSVDNLAYRLNRFLPENIAIQNIRKVKPEAHARFDAELREYKYYISTRKNPFSNAFSYTFYPDLHGDKMNEAAQLLLKNQDFSSFEKLHSDNKTSLCNVQQAYWEKIDEQWVFTIQADRFLRNMVRSIVGTLMEVGLLKIKVEDFYKIIEKKDRTFAAASAPAHGLFLHSIRYPENLFDE